VIKVLLPPDEPVVALVDLGVGFAGLMCERCGAGKGVEDFGVDAPVLNEGDQLGRDLSDEKEVGKGRGRDTVKFVKDKILANGPKRRTEDKPRSTPLSSTQPPSDRCPKILHDRPTFDPPSSLSSASPPTTASSAPAPPDTQTPSSAGRTLTSSPSTSTPATSTSRTRSSPAADCPDQAKAPRRKVEQLLLLLLLLLERWRDERRDGRSPR
jgi:hypothetical protein